MTADHEPTLRVTPPSAPRRRLDPDQLLLITALGGAAVASMVLLVPDSWGAYYATRLWLPLWVLACLVHGGALLESRSPWITRITRVSRHQLVEWGGGAYAAIALVCFAWLEWAQLVELFDWIAQTEWYTDKFGVREIVRDSFRNIFGFFIDSFMNGLYAFIWPAFWKKTFSAGQMWPAALIGWGVFACGQWAVTRMAGDAAPRSTP